MPNKRIVKREYERLEIEHELLRNSSRILAEHREIGVSADRA
jgi:hypothetical protein